MVFYGKTNRLILMSLIASAGFQRLVGFTNCTFSSFYKERNLNIFSGMFECFAAKTFGLYRDNLNALFASSSKLVRWFGNSVFAGVSFNMGPFTITRPHTDNHNLAFGWCAITALGNFNPDRGGHMILWDLGLVIRFPPGSTILIPSALLTHSNAPIGDSEVRYSIIQYSSSGLFRWVYNGFKSDKEFMATATQAQKEQWEHDRKARWSSSLGMFSLWNEICARFT